MILLLFFIIIGYLLGYFINYLPKRNNKKNIQKLELTWNSKTYHMHHWFTFSILILFMFIGRYTNKINFKIVLGLLIGGIVEGFMFKDWYVFQR